MNKVKTIVANLLLSLTSIIVLMLILEFLIFRFILVAPDMPTPDFSNNMVRYKPNQEGIYRVRGEIEAHFKINADGWNSGHENYRAIASLPRHRIAIIGDSYVSAFQVDYDKSMAEQLESNLGSEHFEVYRFGIDGAPLSQYLHMLRREVLQYSPTLLIITLVHNDFYESYGFKPGVYTSAFLKLKIEDNKVTGELGPTPYETPWYNWIRKSATWRFIAIRQQVRFQVLRDIILGEAKQKDKDYQANIDASRINARLLNNEVVTDYVFQKLKEICDANNIELLIIMDGDRNSIYDKSDSSELYRTRSLQLNRLASSVAKKYGISFIDLHPIFENDFSMNKERFSFKNDGHWNAHAHKIVAEVIKQYIENNLICKEQSLTLHPAD